MNVMAHPSPSSSSPYSKYSQSVTNICQTSSSTLPPKWSSRTRSTNYVHTPSPPPIAKLSRSSSNLPLGGRSKTPITNMVLRVAAGMDDPKARDLAYLVEDAKILHKKLSALEMDGVDLKKIGLFSPETLASFTPPPPPPPPTQKRPRGVAYENLHPTKQEKTRRSSSMAAPGAGYNTIRNALSLPRNSISSVNSATGPDHTKSKSPRRNLFSFGRSKGQHKRSSEDLLSKTHDETHDEPRHSVPTLVMYQRLGDKLSEKSGSLSHLVSAGVSQDGALNRSSSLDIINLSSSPTPTPPSRLSSHRSNSKENILENGSASSLHQRSGGLSMATLPPSRQTHHQSLKSRSRQYSVDGILEAVEATPQSPRGSFGGSDVGSYSTVSTTPPLVQKHYNSKPISRHSSADGILRTRDASRSLQRLSGEGSSRSSRSSGSQENMDNNDRTSSIPPSPSSPKPQGIFLKAAMPSNGGDAERIRDARAATCSPRFEKSGQYSSPKSGRRKISAGSPTRTKYSQPDISGNGTPKMAAAKYMNKSSSLPATPHHMCRLPGSRESLSSRAPSIGSSQPNSLHSSEESISSQRNNGKPYSSSGSSARVTVATLVDELTEVEKQVTGSVDEESFDAVERAHKGDHGGIKRSQITASSATLELDQLMQNLEEFEPPAPSEEDRNQGNKKPKSAMDDLSNMLGSLEMDMENIHGVSTVAKGMCAACKKPILAKVLDALGRQWHPEHFTCTACDVELGNITYYESNSRPYCEKDFHELFAPRCAYCNGPILERVMRALDKTWHPEHFFCTLCGKSFGVEGFHEKDSKAFCRECYYENYAPRCRRCSKAIMEGFITALNAQWHPECFSCKVCGITFPRGNYFEHEGEPHCELHYHASRGTLCASCQKPVTGKCVTAMGRKWHPEHFTCAFCLKLLNKGTFKEHRHNPYCQTCYIKLFG